MLEVIEEIFNKFLNFFPVSVQPLVSLVLAVFIIYSVFQALKKNIVYIIALVVLLPASIPVFKNLLDGIYRIIDFLI